jgi:hypothetical protein
MHVCVVKAEWFWMQGLKREGERERAGMEKTGGFAFSPVFLVVLMILGQQLVILKGVLFPAC